MAKKAKKKAPAEPKAFNANKAKQLSRKRAIKNRDQEVADILLRVETEANLEHTSLVHPLVSLAVSKKLSELGFNVTHDQLFDEKCICISW